MSYLVDSDWVADALAGVPAAVELLTSLRTDGLAISLITYGEISLITYGEIYEGIYFGRDPVAAERGLRQFLRRVDALPLNRPILRTVARLRGELRSHGQLIPDADLLIAATALHHGLSLVTRTSDTSDASPAWMFTSRPDARITLTLCELSDRARACRTDVATEWPSKSRRGLVVSLRQARRCASSSGHGRAADNWNYRRLLDHRSLRRTALALWWPMGHSHWGGAVPSEPPFLVAEARATVGVAGPCRLAQGP